MRAMDRLMVQYHGVQRGRTVHADMFCLVWANKQQQCAIGALLVQIFKRWSWERRVDTLDVFDCRYERSVPDILHAALDCTVL